MKGRLVFWGFLFLLACRPTNSGGKSTPSGPDKPLPDTVTKPIATDQPSLDYDTAVWAELRPRPGLILDIKYSTEDNFTGERLYPCGRCFLRPPVYQKLQKLIDSVKLLGLQLVLLDCYRPAAVQSRLWQIKPDSTYVTPPWHTSQHTLGLAIDVTLADSLGNRLDMGTAFDEFSPRSRPEYADLPAQVRLNRQLLSQLLGQADLHPIRSEWWHFSYRQKTTYTPDNFSWKCP